jgi:hypothetical protein
VRRLWLGEIPGPPLGGPLAWAWARPAGGWPATVLAAWGERPRAIRVAKIAAAAIDPSGPPAVLSLAEPRRGVTIPFDDPAVQQARRDALARPAPRACSTLVRGDSVFAGAFTAWDLGAPAEDDPFARVVPARRLVVGPGLVGRHPHPAGPVIERHGSAEPWPADRFPS